MFHVERVRDDIMTELALPAPPTAAETVFGDRLGDVAAYVGLLAEQGVLRGVIGPREVPRLWDRHILNSAAIAGLLPTGSRVLDLGSGAGLPGVPLAIIRPDLRMTLLEPMARRVAWLEEVVETLGLDAAVVRARAEDAARERESVGVDVVLARAVAPLGRLAEWALPLVRPGGQLVAVNGASVPDEIARDAEVVGRAGGSHPEVVRCEVSGSETATTVAVVEKVGRSRGGRRNRKDR
jgi:16S rRNA (guanine527-N7)-methyltransferase